MTLSHWLIYILSQRLVAEVCTSCDNAVFAHFLAVISRTNSNWFEFVGLIAATKSCRSDGLSQKCTMLHEATCCSNLSPRHVAATCRLLCVPTFMAYTGSLESAHKRSVELLEAITYNIITLPVEMYIKTRAKHSREIEKIPGEAICSRFQRAPCALLDYGARLRILNMIARLC